jgi:hypothetical protein
MAAPSKRDGTLEETLKRLRAEDKLGTRIIAKGDAKKFGLAKDIERVERAKPHTP